MWKTGETDNRGGHEALRDTMKDIVVDALGALLAGIIGFVSIRKGQLWYIPALTEPSREAET